MPPKATKGEYIETDTGNKVSRKSNILGTPHIMLAGKTVIQADVTLRGDLIRPRPSSSTDTKKPANHIAISIGRYTILKPRCMLRPPGRLYQGTFTYFPQKVGDHCLIEDDAIVEAAVVGNHVLIGKGAVVGKFAMLRDYVKILDGTVVPDNMIVDTRVVIGGRPGRIVGELGDGWGVIDGSEGSDLREAYRKIG